MFRRDGALYLEHRGESLTVSGGPEILKITFDRFSEDETIRVHYVMDASEVLKLETFLKTLHDKEVR